MFCSSCGAAVAGGAKFCSVCGAAAPAAVETPTRAVVIPEPVPTTPNPPAAVAPEPGPRRVGWLVAGIAVGILVLVGAAVGLALALGGSDSPKASSSRASGKTEAASSTTSAAQKAQAEAAAQAAAADEAMRGFVLSLETILDHSATGRGDVGTLVTQVESGCAIAPNEASIKIREVVGNRTSVLNELAGMSIPAGNPSAAELRSLLQAAINHSVQADTYYQGWMDWLYDDWGMYGNYYWCPNTAPTYSSSYANARAEDGQASAAKQVFVTAFNPVATKYGQRTWDASDF